MHLAPIVDEAYQAKADRAEEENSQHLPLHRIQMQVEGREQRGDANSQHDRRTADRGQLTGSGAGDTRLMYALARVDAIAYRSTDPGEKRLLCAPHCGTRGTVPSRLNMPADW